MSLTPQKLRVDDVNRTLMIQVGVCGIQIGAAENCDVLPVVKHDILVVPDLVAEEIEWTVIVGVEQTGPVAEPTFVTMVASTLARQRGGEQDDRRKARQIGDEAGGANGGEMFSHLDGYG